MKLVLYYTIGDGCSWSADETVPFEYESKEKAEYDLLELWEKCAETPRDKYTSFEFAGRTYDAGDFSFYDEQSKKIIYNEPIILELDEWFEQFKPVDKSPQ